MELDTKTDWLTDWLTDRQSQCDFDFDFELSLFVIWWPAGNGVSAEAEESPLLEAVIGKQVVKTLKTEKT
jgi:hypothetical protein